MDDLLAPAVCYADDIILMACSKKHLEEMIKDVVAEFKAIGLGIGEEKTHWTSTPAMPGLTLEVGSSDVPWQATLVFVGVALDLSGSSTAAINYRMQQGMNAMHRWKPLLCSRWLPLAQRAKLLPIAIWTSLLWGASTWTPTKAMADRVASWGARAMSTVANIRRAPAEEIGQWWRRLHRQGYRLLQKYTVAPDIVRKLNAHRWAGHLARLDPVQPAAKA